MAIKFLNTVAVDTDVLYVDASSNNVGIGTTSPERQLSLYSNNTETTPRLLIEQEGTGDAVMAFSLTGGQGWSMGIDNSGGDSFMIHDSSGGVDSSSQFTIKTNGNVGIGTTSPESKLHVAGGDVLISNGQYYTAESITGQNFQLATITTGNVVAIGAIDYTSATTIFAGGDNVSITTGGVAGSSRLKILSNGNVGIGTTSPSTTLQVYNSTEGQYMEIGAGDGGGRSLVFTSSNNNGSAGALHTINAKSINGVIALSTAGSEAIRITSAGNVGIGTTNPSEKLEVAGNARITGDVTLSNGNALRWTSDDVRIEGTTAGDNIKFYVANTEILQLAQSGTLATVTGNLRVTGAYYDSNNLPGTSGQVLSSTATGTDWVSLSEISGVDGTGTTNYVAKWSDTDTITDSVIYDDGTNVGIGTTNPLELFHVHQGNSGGSANIAADEILVEGDGDTGITISSPSSNIGTLAFGDESVSLRGALRYDHSDDSMIFRVSSAEKMRITSTGNVGIGTTSPTEKLEVSGNILIDSIGQELQFSNHSVGAYRDGSNRLMISGYGGIRFQAEAVGGMENQATRMVINPSGNVGIGVNSPSSKLHVNSGAENTVALFESADARSRIVLKDNSGEGQLNALGDNITFATSSSATERMRITSNGNVGIGTTSPNAALQINGGTSNNSNRSNVALFTGNNAGGLVDALGLINGATATFGNAVALNFHNASSYSPTGAIRVYQVSSGTITDASMRFYTYQGGLTEKMRITPAGNIGIGTDSPVNKLNVNGDIGYIGVIGQGSIYGNTGNSSYANMQLYNPSTGYSTFNNQSYGYYFQTAGSTKVTILNNGDVGIGTTSPNYKLEVNGGARAGGVVTYSKNYGSLNTTGNAVAGLTTSFNGASAGFTFTCFGHGGYQKVVYSCYNVSGTWNTIKVIDEGTNAFDVEASANATTITFTFKSTSGTKSYTPRVTVEATGSAINSTYA